MTPGPKTYLISLGLFKHFKGYLSHRMYGISTFTYPLGPPTPRLPNTGLREEEWLDSTHQKHTYPTPWEPHFRKIAWKFLGVSCRKGRVCFFYRNIIPMAKRNWTWWHGTELGDMDHKNHSFRFQDPSLWIQSYLLIKYFAFRTADPWIHRAYN